MRKRQFALAALAIAVLVVLVLLLPQWMGHRSGPRAPALRDEPVYENSREGVRFLAPEGWTEVAKSDPPETDASDRVLVAFQRIGGETAAYFELSRAGLAESADLPGLLAQPSHGSAAAWRPAGKAESLTMDGLPAARYAFLNADKSKETTTVRRGGRVYFFTVVGAKADDKARQQIRRIVADVKWTK